MRYAPCFECDCCVRLDWEEMLKAPEDGGCKNIRCGKPKLVNMTTVKDPGAVLQTDDAENDGASPRVWSPNPLFAKDNTLMMFGDGKKAILELVAALKE